MKNNQKRMRKKQKIIIKGNIFNGYQSIDGPIQSKMKLILFLMDINKDERKIIEY